MKKILLMILFITIYLFSAEFEVISFEKDMNDKSATNEDTKLIDVNGNECALVKVLTDLKNISFESSLLEKVKNAKEGEYWVYLPKNTKRLKFKKEGIRPKTFEFTEKLTESTVYILELAAVGLEEKIEKLSITVITTPTDAIIFIDGENLGKVKQILVSVGMHDIVIEKEFYETIREQIEVTASKTFFEYDLKVDVKGELVFVKGGNFKMGTNDKKSDDEYPSHSVTVNDFFIGKTEVTQAQWEAVMGENPSFDKGENLPVTHVSWYDAVKYCNKLSEVDGLEKCYEENKGFFEDKATWKCDFKANGYRLPTEAEWEYAARGGSESRGYTYSGSDNADDVSWQSGQKWDIGSIKNIGTKKPNELGIYDMSGNVSEWCWDWYDEYYYWNSPSKSKNPKGPKSGSRRATRGGSWATSSENCRVVNHNNPAPGERSSDCGFRVVRSQ